MLAKLAVLLSRVPHYVLAAALLVSLYGPDFLPIVQSTPFGPYLAKAVSFAIGILALAKQFNPGTTASTTADKAIIAKRAPVPPLPVWPFALVMLLGCTNAATVQNALSPAETCIASDAIQVALSGGFANPAQAIASILGACAGTTIDDVIALLNKLSLPTDGGVMPPALAALRAEALREKGAK